MVTEVVVQFVDPLPTSSVCSPRDGSANCGRGGGKVGGLVWLGSGGLGEHGGEMEMGERISMEEVDLARLALRGSLMTTVASSSELMFSIPPAVVRCLWLSRSLGGCGGRGGGASCSGGSGGALTSVGGRGGGGGRLELNLAVFALSGLELSAGGAGPRPCLREPIPESRLEGVQGVVVGERME